MCEYYMDNAEHECVLEFMDVFEAPRNVEFWATLVEEEFKEVKEALEHLLKEASDLRYVLNGFAIASDEEGLSEGEALETLEDLFPGMLGKLHCQLDKLDDVFDEATSVEAFHRIHSSNMSKVGDDGKPVRHPETGKILKGTNYVAPDLMDLI